MNIITIVNIIIISYGLFSIKLRNEIQIARDDNY